MAADETNTLPVDTPLPRLAALIAARELSSRELVSACLKQIAEANPVLNAVVQLRADAALADAEIADREVARGELRGPLHGVPFTVKGWIDAVGLPCTGGAVEYRDRMPERDATVVARLRAAGGILLGKTNVGVQNAVYGRTNNPYNPRYSPAAARAGRQPLLLPEVHRLVWAAIPAGASASLRTAAVLPA